MTVATEIASRVSENPKTENENAIVSPYRSENVTETFHGGEHCSHQYPELAVAADQRPAEGSSLNRLEVVVLGEGNRIVRNAILTTVVDQTRNHWRSLLPQ